MFYLLDSKKNDLLRWSNGELMIYKSASAANAAALVRNIRLNSKRYVVLGPH